MPKIETAFTKQTGVEFPIICGPMFPCSNPELIGAVSEAGGMGIIQPVSMVFVHKYDFRDGMKKIRSITKKPVGFNVLVEKSQKVYEERMKNWIDIALEEGVRFFITALGNPKWVVDKVKPFGATVYHDVVDKKWALKALDSGVDGLICVNSRAGGHAGSKDPRFLFDDLAPLGVPLICAGGVGDEQKFAEMLKIGYAGVQMGTRFIATNECNSDPVYKDAILKAEESDIVLTEKLTAVPVAIINTPYVQKTGTKASPIARMMMKHNRMKHWVRSYYSIKSAFQLRRAIQKGFRHNDFYQAGKSVSGIEAIEPAGEIVRRYADYWMKNT